MTEKLFWQNSYQTDFSARVVEQFPLTDGSGIVLDQTCFYATSGGQPHDLGTINSFPVKDVRLENGRLVHVLSNPIQTSTVEGVIDWQRRFDHMQQHTGQHILSAAFFKLFQAETSSFHLGEEYCSIELNQPNLSEAQIAKAESRANEIIFAATEVTSFFVDSESAGKYPLRKQSDLTESLRIIQIGDFDLSPCSGTHVKNSAEIGMVFVYGHEKLSRSMKITFVCGNRIHSRFKRDLTVLKSLSKTLTTSFELLPDSVGKLQSQLKELRKENTRFKEENLKREAVELANEASSWNEMKLLIRTWDRPYQEIRFLAQTLTEQENMVGALASTSDQRVVFFKNPSMDFNLKPAFQAFLSKTGAKGGGPPHLMEAGNIQDSDRLETILRASFQ